jgi:hypothetical protein
MSLQPRDRRALAALGIAAVLSLIIFLWPSGDSTPDIASAVPTSIPDAEHQLVKLRQTAGTIPARAKIAGDVKAQLVEREKAFLPGDTAAQAQANLVKIVQRLARSQNPPVDVGQIEMGQIRGLGKDYGEALVSMSTNCRIEQLVNLLADISSQPEMIATQEMRVMAGDQKQKTMTVRLTLSGVIARRLVPERRGVGLF